MVGVDNFCTGRAANIEHLKDESRFSVVERDICVPFDLGPVDFVFNFASPASPVDYMRLGIETLRVGSEGTKNALEVARKYGAGFLHASTSECYGDPTVHPQPESYWGHVNPIGPRSVYDEAKRFSEALVMGYHRYYKRGHAAGADLQYVRTAAAEQRRASDFEPDDAGIARRRPHHLRRWQPDAQLLLRLRRSGGNSAAVAIGASTCR